MKHSAPPSGGAFSTLLGGFFMHINHQQIQNDMIKETALTHKTSSNTDNNLLIGIPSNHHLMEGIACYTKSRFAFDN